MSIVFLCGLVGLFFLFGFLFATRVLRLSNVLPITAMTLFAGEALYIVTLNAFGYFLPIHVAFWAALIFLVCIIFLCLLLPKTPITEAPPRWVFLGLWLFTLTAGIAFARTNASDWDSLIHYPVPATILEGNFPIHDPFNPGTRYGYHYAGMLFAAATTALTGVDLAVSYAIQPFLSASALVFFVAAIGYALVRSWKGAFVITLLACGGGGFHWLYALPFIRDLISTYVLHQPLHPEHQTTFRFLSYMFGAIRAQPMLNTLEHRSVGLGIAAFMASLYAFFELTQAVLWRQRIARLVAVLVFTALLALSLETSLVILFAGIAGVVVFQKTLVLPAYSTRWLLIALTLSTAIIVIQGGVITEALTFKGYTRPSSFVLNTDGRYHFSSTKSLGFWEWSFIRDAGFPLLLLPIVVFAAWWQRKRSWMPLLLAGLACMHMTIPFVIGFPHIEHGMDRVIHVGIGLSAFLIGWWLWLFFFQSQSSFRRNVAYVVVVSMLLSTALHLPVRLLFPGMRFEQTSFIPQMPQRSDAEKNMHEWVRNNSNADDYFFFLQSSRSRNKIHDPEFSFFVTFTGRFLVQRSFTFDSILGKEKMIITIEQSCSNEALHNLSIDYIVAYTDEQRSWFTSKCQQASFQEVYSASEIQIYRFIASLPSVS